MSARRKAKGRDATLLSATAAAAAAETEWLLSRSRSLTLCVVWFCLFFFSALLCFLLYNAMLHGAHFTHFNHKCISFFNLFQFLSLLWLWSQRYLRYYSKYSRVRFARLSCVGKDIFSFSFFLFFGGRCSPNFPHLARHIQHNLNALQPAEHVVSRICVVYFRLFYYIFIKFK